MNLSTKTIGAVSFVAASVCGIASFMLAKATLDAISSMEPTYPATYLLVKEGEAGGPCVNEDTTSSTAINADAARDESSATACSKDE